MGEIEAETKPFQIEFWYDISNQLLNYHDMPSNQSFTTTHGTFGQKQTLALAIFCKVSRANCILFARFVKN